MNFLHDVRYALRPLRQNPTVTLVAIVALTLGIGANTAIFSVVNAVLLKPLPYKDPASLVTLLSPGSLPLSPGDFIDIKTQAKSIESAGAAEGWGGNLTGGEKPEHVVGLRMSEGMFDVLGIHPVQGRTFMSDDFQPGKENTLVVSYGFWQRHLGASSDTIGKSIKLDGMPYTIVGVMPQGFQFAPFWITQADIWTPMPFTNLETNRGAHSLRVFARLKPGATIAAAQSEVDTICRNLSRAYPNTDTNLRIVVESLNEKVVGNIRTALLIIVAAVGFVLLIACANVANLLLARATGRQREIAIRISLGANRIRIIRQFLTESVVLALAGAIPAILLARWATHALQLFLQPDAGAGRARLIRSGDISVDTTVLFYTLALAVITGILFGVAPAILASKLDLNGRMKEGGRSMTAGRGATTRKILVATEVALAIVLLCGASLLMRSFLNLRAINPGFEPHNVLAMTVSVAGQSQYIGAGRENLYRAIVRNIEAVPGIQSAALINHVPLAGDMWGFSVVVEGHPRPIGQTLNGVYRVAGPNYFSTMRIPLIGGREFNDNDTAASPRVVIVNEVLAKREWPNGDALGKRVSIGDPTKAPQWRTIVGVSKNVKQMDWTSTPSEEFYLPLWQTSDLLTDTHNHLAYISLVARAKVDAPGLTHAVENATWSVDRNLPIHVQTLDHAIGNATWQPRFNLLLIGIFAGIAMLLAMIGIYGVLSYEITERTQELGIRIALGAERAGILKLVFGQSFKVVIAGTAAGLLATMALARLMTSLLYEVKPLDPITFVAVTILVLTIAAAASLIPARRATAIDPITALRWE